MSQRQKKASLAAVACVLIAVLAGLIWMTTGSLGPHRAIAQQGGGREGIDGRTTAVALYMTGLDPEALAAAGASSQGVAAVVAAAGAVVGNGTDFLAMTERLGSAQRAHDRVLRLVRRGQGSLFDQGLLGAAAQELTAAQSARDSFLEGLFTTATQPISNVQRTALAGIRANRSQPLPTVYLVTDRTDAQWTALREALANERIAARTGGATDSGAAALLSAVRGETAVAATTSNSASRLQETTASFDGTIALFTH